MFICHGNMFTTPWPRNGCLLLHCSGFQPSRHNMFKSLPGISKSDDVLNRSVVYFMISFSISDYTVLNGRMVDE
jgi:hypothetical protein